MNEEKPLPWWFRRGGMIFAFALVGPLALILVWIHPRMSLAGKIVSTLVTVIVSYFLIRLTDWSLQMLMKNFGEITALLNQNS